ncbi:MAG: hypothetical protein JSV89_10390 [Spirochaetaceae bacterium]|nr:MAG: hypothetical protein JSV89_10390 [Spirochaetaceae bacterium]
MLQEIGTIQQFYRLMKETGEVRRRLVARIMEGRSAVPPDSERLGSYLQALKRIPRRHGRYQLSTGLSGSQRSLYLELDYEIDELEKDLVFFQYGEQALLDHLAGLHTGFQEELSGAAQFCRDMSLPLNCLVSDRDGTVNNYCGRYLSSIQSAYNAVFLSRFAEKAVRRAVLLTSAPLSNGGLEELTVSPPGNFILAGSKGREYLDQRGRRGALAIEAGKQEQLQRLNRRLADLLQDPRYRLFDLIGSGLQFKFGQTTVARQDIYGSIPKAESEAFAGVIQRLIREIDPDRLYFRTEDTGKDIEIILTVEGESGLKDFDKGDGVLFLDSELGLDLSRGGNLVCGDTASDLPMVSAAAKQSANLWTIFVSRDESLQARLRRICERAHFVSEPDVLVCLLNRMGREMG